MDGFNSLLIKLREIHEREVEGWQMKIQELSNKKGCDTKRMEELFSKNQQMKEQQKLLTENIKTLENRLRAGLCDRCTVTQEVAKRRQQEFEASHLQGLHHISLLAAEMTSLKKENRRLRDDIKLLKASIQKSHNDRSSNSSHAPEVKPKPSPDLSSSSNPVAMSTTATSTANNLPADGEVTIKTEADQRSEEPEHRQWSSISKAHFDSNKPPSTHGSPPTWKTEHGVPLVRERTKSAEGLDQQPPIPPQALLLMPFASAASGDVNLSRHVVHAPVPYRPQPIKSSALTLPWTSGSNLLLPPSTKANQLRFPNLISPGQHGSLRRQTFEFPWYKQGSSKSSSVEPTLLFRLKNLTENLESQTKPEEKTDVAQSNPERVSGEGLREVCDGPLDLSDQGKSKSSQSPRDYSAFVLKGAHKVQKSPDSDQKTNASPHGSVPSSHCAPPVKQREEEPAGDNKNTVISKEEEQENGKTDQSSEKKVPILTISLRPVVVLETLNTALQRQEFLTSNEKNTRLTSLSSQSLSPAVELLSSGDEQVKEESESEQERNPSCKRKRASEDSDTERDSDTDNIQPERKIKITLRNDKSPKIH